MNYKLQSIIFETYEKKKFVFAKITRNFQAEEIENFREKLAIQLKNEKRLENRAAKLDDESKIKIL